MAYDRTAVVSVRVNQHEQTKLKALSDVYHVKPSEVLRKLIEQDFDRQVLKIGHRGG
jgi:hypothetical protein